MPTPRTLHVSAEVDGSKRSEDVGSTVRVLPGPPFTSTTYSRAATPFLAPRARRASYGLVLNGADASGAGHHKVGKPIHSRVDILGSHVAVQVHGDLGSRRRPCISSLYWTSAMASG